MNFSKRPLSRSILTSVLLMVLLTASVEGQAQFATGTIRVGPSGTDGGGCGATLSPCRTLQFAVDEFPDAGGGTIQVAAGSYTSVSTRVVRITSGRNISIRGGYTAAFTDEDPDTNVVTIDGQTARRGILIDHDPMSVFRKPHLTLVGVTLRNGNAPTELLVNTLSSFGGGLDAFQASVVLFDVKVIDNVAQGLSSNSLPGDGSGGGLSFRQSTAFLSGVEFTGNSAGGGDGTAGAVRGGLGVGGAVFAFESTVTLNNVTATSNTAAAGDAPTSVGVAGIQRADALGGFLAWILSTGGASGLTATANRAEGGDASDFGGLGLGGAIMIEESPNVVALGSTLLSDNAAIGGLGTGPNGGLGGGGAIFSTDSVLTLDASTLTINQATGGNGTTNLGGDGAGGAVYMDSTTEIAASLWATNVVLGKNAVAAGSGPVNPGIAFGGGVFQQCPGGVDGCAGTSNQAFLTHVTLADNSVSNGSFNQGSALYVSAGAAVDSFSNIISGHATPPTNADRGESILVWGSADFDATLWDGNTVCASNCPIFNAPGGMSTDTDTFSGAPAYVNSAANAPDYHITDSSAALDEADRSTTPFDLDHEARPFDPMPGPVVADLGADERCPAPCLAPPVISERLVASTFGDGRLLLLDPLTGLAEGIGSGPAELTGLSSWKGRLFGLWGPDQLIEMDPATGAVLSSVPTGIGEGVEGAVAIRSDGVAFAIRGATSVELWRFDLQGGGAQLIKADIGQPLDGLAFDSNDLLFGLSESLSLYDVNTVNGTLTLIGSTGLSGPSKAGLAFSASGSLRAAIGNTLYGIDSATAAPTSLGSIGTAPFTTGEVSGLVFVPEPQQRPLSVAALVTLSLLLGIRRRQRAPVEAR
jgi:hypothetical protein